MPRIYVCCLDKIEEIAKTSQAGRMLTLMRADAKIPRPPHIAQRNHLHLDVSDITTAIDGYSLPARQHIEDLLDFVETWDQTNPLLIHCFAGISRSVAAAMITLCALRPTLDDRSVAGIIRARSPTAKPNTRIIELGDEVLGREGRLIRAVEQMSPPEPCHRGIPFHLDLP